MDHHELLAQYRKVYDEMIAHIEWMKTTYVSFYEMSPDGVREDTTQRQIAEAEVRAENLAKALALMSET